MKLGETTLVKDCMICHREVILIARKNTKYELPPKDSTLPQVCEECQTKYLTEGILLINPNTGRLVVLKESAFKRIFSGPPADQALKTRIAFTDDTILEKLQENSQ
ncbi:MAG: hypothetical protein WC444_06110 [Candidatus Paceibacterota bacterium]